MNIQIFGKSKCFDTKKAHRYFKERRVKYQEIDLPRYGMSRGEIRSVISSVGLDAVINHDAPGAEILEYLAYDSDREAKLLEMPELIRTPVVRNGTQRQTSKGYALVY